MAWLSICPTHYTVHCTYTAFCTLHTEQHTCSHVCGKSSSWLQRLPSSGITVYAIASLFALANMSMCWKYLDYTVEVIIVWIILWWIRQTLCALQSTRVIVTWIPSAKCQVQESFWQVPVSLLYNTRISSAKYNNKYKSHCGKYKVHCTNTNCQVPPVSL